MASVMALSDRRARLALILALLGFPSLGITVPAAIWLGAGAVRQRRLASGGEPAMGFIALVVAGLDLMLLQSVLLRTVEAIGPQRTVTWFAWGLALTAASVVCAAAVLRTHPERWGALLVARSGLVGSMAGGTLLFVLLLMTFD